MYAGILAEAAGGKDAFPHLPPGVTPPSPVQGTVPKLAAGVGACGIVMTCLPLRYSK